MHAALQKHFGYSTFRPLQQEVIRDILNTQDTFVLMPTGGGKSLCYQLPSLMMDGVTIVISPLISLMKDQVDALVHSGIRAAYLNSTLTPGEQQQVMQSLQHNKIALLYVAPERLVQEHFLSLLQSLHINFFAIDEAHCISQWGHDFRPEYRQLHILKQQFPKIPIVALTATATPRVKDDILTHLHLKNPGVYQASFNRPNLSYYVYPKHNAFDQTLNYLEKHKHDSGIIYCQSRKTVEQVANRLQEEGINALPYHAGLTNDIRKKNQEAFIRDNCQVIIATIAFGMGINKPNVRYVIHYNLPKTLEHYYQETGRAGRDGLPSECVFLYSYADKFFYERFIDEKQTQEERQIAQAQLQTVIHYAQSKLCRRVQLLGYFAEKYQQDTCNACDNCLSPKELFDGTVLSQKILSCIYRTQERFGASHIIKVLTGSKSQKVLDNKHHLLSTYDIVQDYSALQLKTFIYELLQLGFIEQTQDQYAVLTLTSKGKRLLKGLEKVSLTKPEEEIATTEKFADEKQLAMNKTLFEKLRHLRKKLADQINLPPYIIFPDTSLQEMATYYPQTKEQFAQIHGVGEEKLKNYAEVFLKEITTYCKENGKQPIQKTFRKHKKNKNQKSESMMETYRLYKSGKSPQQIAHERGYAEETIHKHLQKAYVLGESIDIDLFVPASKQKIIEKAFHELNTTFLAPVKEKLGEAYSYEELRWVQAKMMKESLQKK